MNQIGVIIPTYNRAALLRETLESVLAQTRPPDAVIVVDDGGTDDTRAVVAAFKDERIRYHWQENAYLGAARNTGQRLAGSTDLLLFLDSDDRLLPCALERLEAALAAHPDAALAYGRSQVIDAAGKIVQRTWGKKDYQGDIWDRLIETNFLPSAGCALIRRAHLDQTEPWDTTLRGVEDWDMWLRLAEKGAPFVRVSGNAPLFEYRTHADGMSRDEKAMHASVLAVYRKHSERNAERHPVRAVRTKALYEIRVARTPAGGLQRRHQLLRALGEKSGFAALYRRLPLNLRLKLRVVAGIDPWA